MTSFFHYTSLNPQTHLQLISAFQHKRNAVYGSITLSGISHLQ